MYSYFDMLKLLRKLSVLGVQIYFLYSEEEETWWMPNNQDEIYIVLSRFDGIWEHLWSSSEAKNKVPAWFWKGVS